MLISIIKQDIIKRVILPNQIQGSYWISDIDENGTEKNLISIEASPEGWKLISNKEVYCLEDNMRKQYFILNNYQFYEIKNTLNKEIMKIYCSPLYDKSYIAYDLSLYQNKEILIGKAIQCQIIYSNNQLNDVEAKLVYSNNTLIIYPNTQSSNSIYIRNNKINSNRILKNGDVIFVMGLKIIYFIFDKLPTLIINNPNNKIEVKMNQKVDLTNINNPYIAEDEEEININVYNDSDYFHKKPRFIQLLEEYQLSIDPPPQKESENKMPLLLTIGPMFTTSLIAVMYGFNAYNTINRNNGDITSAIPQMIMCFSMLAGTIIWPIATKKYNKKKSRENEKLRQEKYKKYIDDLRDKILTKLTEQRNILINNNPSILESQKTIIDQSMNLWQRRVEDQDFITVNLGIGSLPMKINIKYPEEHFSMIDDNLKDLSLKLGREPKILDNVPISLSLRENNILALIGEEQITANYMQRLLIQLVAYQSYDNLKIVILTSEDNIESWRTFKMLPHCWNDSKTFRFFGTCTDDYKEICYSLDGIYSKRVEEKNDILYNPYYLIITDCFKAIRNFEVIKNIFESKVNIGFSMIILNDKISNLPDQCQTFIEIKNTEARLFKTVLNTDATIIKPDFETPLNLDRCVSILANIPIEFTDDQSGQMPEKVGFLEMYDIGKVEQFNSLNRWETSNPMLSLRAPVGIGRSGEKISIDLHEKYHGPHGLVAGMTGSGKSEFLITYILSMAINYHPYEVQFILIDYKGGGLAGAFENKITGVKLPHLVGTITNLDSNEIKRSLSSIQSELKRRQHAFNKAREISRESTIDIYKYQKMYRDHIVDEPISHLFVISDEFAELKNQEPEFMDELISAARIGRSLGVHLILATQKPSGVVNAQIWSNTRFRVCLRVQDVSDSTEVIKCPDAAYLKQTGRFYFQVGTNEIFTQGQSAYCGVPYIPSETINREIDTSIEFINNNGLSIKSIDNNKKEIRQVENKGEELSNIVNYLSNLAKEQNIKTKQLWLPKIPELIYIEQIKRSYNYKPQKYIFNPVIGIYDNPTAQYQNLAQINLTNNGNTIIYGMSGSGEELLLNTLIYSLSIEHTPEEVNIYSIDCGSETLNIFRNFPHIGDIALINETEKIENLFKLLNDEITKRKKLFVEYNGDYNYYCTNSGKTLPAIIVIINNYESFKETYGNLEETIKSITRECTKYGIYLILSVNSTTGVRSTIRQNFGNLISLQLTDKSNYSYIFGNIHKLEPSKLYGRGLIKIDQVYEFQTAHICEDDNLVSYIKQLTNKLIEVYPNYKAKKIPILPEAVTIPDLNINQYTSLSNLPIGIDKETIQPVTYNFMQDKAQLILTAYQEDIPKIIYDYTPLFSKYSNVLVIDCQNIIEPTNNYTLIQDNFDNTFKQLLELQNQNNRYLCLIIGLDNFTKKISPENKKSLDKLFNLSNNIINYIIVGTPEMIKPLEYELWYKKSIDNKQGIWVGNGIAEQTVLKIENAYKLSKIKISTNFAIVIKRGSTIITKILQ